MRHGGLRHLVVSKADTNVSKTFAESKFKVRVSDFGCFIYKFAVIHVITLHSIGLTFIVVSICYLTYKYRGPKSREHLVKCIVKLLYSLLNLQKLFEMKAAVFIAELTAL